MTIEAHLKSIDASLVTIALNLSAIAEGAGVEVPKSASGKKPAASSTSRASGKGKAATTDSKSTGKPAKSETKEEPKLEDVRAALTALQEATDGKTARELLAKVGGNGALGKVKPAKYQAVIDAAGEATEEASD